MTPHAILIATGFALIGLGAVLMLEGGRVFQLDRADEGESLGRLGTGTIIGGIVLTALGTAVRFL